ncbi:GntR family transcriptional regulator [Paenibacillus swuensis]|uniref:GntR family transcriptional regulator n=1 Tax=Paenibacillus swuensis TaxID=1178515 RepID=A0A172TLP5_9BACL|nr:PLP-dependent aminotransferase family protein [Paenibacillus swuensis]ANE47737.1 GntR family transcriptional regulator [Paenibacillus swuensis]
MKKYLEVLSDLEQKMNHGQFVSGQKLPSVRNAAKHYGCSVSTITRAYAELENNHSVYSIAQSGYYVVEKQRNRPNVSESNRIDFASTSPDPSVFPYLDFKHSLDKALDTYKFDLFTCGDSKGMETLRHTLISHLAGEQVFAKVDWITITSGANRALEILAKMPFPNGNSVILVEQPSYDLYLRFLEAEGIPVCGISRSTAGIDLRELEEKFIHGGIKFFYTMPRYHNPLGTSYSADDRRIIARLASKYNVYIVEDDYMADLGEERGMDPIYSYNATSHVVYLKSFSKIIFPGLRLGVAVLPEKVIETFYEYQRYADTSQLSQAALEVYIQNGMYERHKRKISKQYAARIIVLNEAVKKHNAAGLLQISEVQSGVFIQFKMPQKVNLERLVERLAAMNIFVVSGKQFYLSGYMEREKFIRISISRAQPEQIEAGVRMIIEEVGREVKSPF